MIKVPECILLDIESQRDFFSRGGAFYSYRTSGAVARQIYRLFVWSRRCGLPVLSTVLRIRPGDLGPFGPAAHLVEGTWGEEKLAKTILTRRINLGLRNTTDLPDHIFRDYQQVIFEKRHADIFGHARAERLITELPPATFILCGGGTEVGIRQAAVGLRNRGFSVIVAADAVLDVRPELAAMARERMAAKGVVFVPTDRIVAPSPPPRRSRFRSPEPVGRQAF